MTAMLARSAMVASGNLLAGRRSAHGLAGLLLGRLVRRCRWLVGRLAGVVRGLRRSRRRRGRGAAAAVRAVEARSLEDDPHRREHLPEAAAAVVANGERVVAELLDGLHLLTALSAGVLIRGHSPSFTRAQISTRDSRLLSISNRARLPQIPPRPAAGRHARGRGGSGGHAPPCLADPRGVRGPRTPTEGASGATLPFGRADQAGRGRGVRAGAGRAAWGAGRSWGAAGSSSSSSSS